MRHVTVQQLSAFLDGALTGVSRDLVTRHLAACADCRERHALWHIYDEVLQRVLSWEPNERTMEEASARVELTLTAERRGLPPPEFTSALHAVIAGSPRQSSSPAGSGLFPALPPVAAAAAAAAPAPARQPAPPPPAAAPPPPAAPAPPLPVASAPLPVAPVAPVAPPVTTPTASPVTTPSSALSFPLDPQPQLSPPTFPPYPPVPSHARYQPPPAPAAHEPVRPWPEPAVRPWPEPSPVPVQMPGQVPWASVPLPKRRKRRGRLLATCLVLLALVAIATPFLPDVIRVYLPESWGPRVPRVEFVHHDKPAAPVLDPRLHLAERTSSEPPPLPYRALPAPVESAAAQALEQAAASVPIVAVVKPHADSLAPQAPAPVVAAPRPLATEPPAKPPAARSTAKPKPKPPATRTRPAPPVAAHVDEDEQTTAGAAHSMTFVPVQVKTEVRLSSVQGSTAPATAADTTADAAMPLLCGEVVDESGGPIEGARIQLTSPPLTLRTDKRGRFCVACPAGERTFLVDAPGYTAVTRGVELTDGTFETHVTLEAAHQP